MTSERYFHKQNQLISLLIKIIDRLTSTAFMY